MQINVYRKRGIRRPKKWFNVVKNEESGCMREEIRESSQVDAYD